MRKLISIIALVFILSIASVFAAFEVSDVQIGRDSQERGQTTTVDVSVKNTGVSLINNFNATFSGVASKYVAKIISAPSSIAAGATATVRIQTYVPLDFDAVDTKGKVPTVGSLDGFSIGSIVFNGNGVAQKSVTLVMQAENLLEFTSKSRIKYGDEDERLKEDDYKDVRRGDIVYLEIEAENNFDNDGNCDEPNDYGDCDIEDIEVELDPDDSDFDDDTDDFSSIRAKDEDTLTLSFDVPDDMNDGDYDFDLFMTGEDENGARHGDFIKFTLEVDVPKNEISIDSAILSPSSLECTQSHTTLRVTIHNTGRNDQNDAAIFVESTALNFKKTFYNIEIDEDEKVTRSFDMSIPDDTKPGSYYVIIRSHYDNDEETDTESVTLTVKDCNANEDIDDDEFDFGDSDDNSDTNVNIIEVPPSTGVIVGEEKEQSFFESTGYLMMLGGLFLVALLVFILLAALLLRR